MKAIQQLQHLRNIDPNLFTEPFTTEKPVIYQVLPRLFGNKKQVNKKYGTIDENGSGKLDDFNDHALHTLKNMGFTHIWFTGIVEHATLTDFRKYEIPLNDADVVKGRAGSPYAIKDYYDISPELVTDVPNRMQEFENLLDRTHNQGLKVIIDFVPNHVAREYHSDAKPAGIEDLGSDDNTSIHFDPQNNFYYFPGKKFKAPDNYEPLGSDGEHPTKNHKFEENPAKATGNDCFSPAPSVNDWFETVKLNYGVDYQNNEKHHFDPIPDTWHKMHDILLFWAQKGVDGFRCDMVEMVPIAFWKWVIANVKAAFPNIIFIGEAYQVDKYRPYLDAGFDYLYDKVQLYDTLKYICGEQQGTAGLSGIWQFQRDIHHNMLHFMENHDEVRLASKQMMDSSMKPLPGMALSALIHTGPVMHYFGQEVQETGDEDAGFSGPDGRTTIFDYWGLPELQKWVNDGKFDGKKLSDGQQCLIHWYKSLYNLRQQPAIKQGYLYDLHPHNLRVTPYYPEFGYSFIRFCPDQVLVIVINFSEFNEVSFDLKIPKTALQAMDIHSGYFKLQDIFISESETAFDFDKVIVNEIREGMPVELKPLEVKVFEVRS